ncbi:hypothetical protein [Streptomyces cupreus]|uniref:Uncharacterized protein n=1 Tax=Streptomyces cupreus TaxID=2759956 RepID=A0A7X1MAW2_9ACTN|nr:hypothetical protein [Streptomyces cupreus]MBC2904764.1 hypothetical protein [Streptomyces cupreus]
MAQIHQCAERLPRGRESLVGEDAYPSSGWARRVSIARALADMPALVPDVAIADVHEPAG